MMDVRFLALVVACALLLGWSKADNSTVELKGRIPSGFDIFVNYAAKDTLEKTNERVKLAKSGSEGYESDRRALLAGDIDFVISDHPFEDGPSGGQVLHFPVATGGYVLVANVVPTAQPLVTAKQLVGIFGGGISRWNNPLLIKDNPDFQTVDLEITIVTWDLEGPATVELRRYLEFNSEGDWPASKPFSERVVHKNSFEEALQYVKDTPGCITYVPYKSSGDAFPFSIFIPQSNDFVSPTQNAFVNALMPLKKPTDLPKAYETVSWHQFSLTDMRKMPPDGSCMSMPPYPLSHFFYFVMKRDQASRPENRGAAIAAFLRVMSSEDIQNTAASTGIVSSAPVAAQLANAQSIETSILFREGESLQTFLENVPIKDATPGDNMPNMGPGQGMGDMQPASTSVVIAVIVCLLLSGVTSVAAYIAYLKCRHGGSFSDHATWVPWTIRKNTKPYAALETISTRP